MACICKSSKAKYAFQFQCFRTLREKNFAIHQISNEIFFWFSYQTEGLNQKNLTENFVSKKNLISRIDDSFKFSSSKVTSLNSIFMLTWMDM